MFKSNYFVILALVLFFAICTSSCTTTPVLQEEVNYLEKAEYYKDQKNYEEAVRWYRKAAEQGDADVQNNLGGLYFYGYGVEQNYKEAIK